jgi:hypothetical protein
MLNNIYRDDYPNQILNAFDSLLHDCEEQLDNADIPSEKIQWVEEANRLLQSKASIISAYLNYEDEHKNVPEQMKIQKYQVKANKDLADKLSVIIKEGFEK